MKNIFSKSVTDEVIGRINALTPQTTPDWGKMNASQMLAHCSVTYEMLYDGNHPKPNILMGFMLRTFVKDTVVSEKPYKRNSRTAPAFLITDERDFEKEKKRLVDYMFKTQTFGEAHFENKESHSFGKLSITEWNNMFYKHLDHHLTQFGV